MNILELQEKSLELRKQLAEVIATGQKEERELTENEKNYGYSSGSFLMRSLQKQYNSTSA